jgi:hypothetical protein
VTLSYVTLTLELYDGQGNCPVSGTATRRSLWGTRRNTQTKLTLQVKSPREDTVTYQGLIGYLLTQRSAITYPKIRA